MISSRAATRLIDRLLGAPRTHLLVEAGVAILLISCLDWYSGDVSLAALYILPVLLVALVFSPAQIVAVAAFCSFLRLLFSPPPSVAATVMSGGFAFLSYGLLGLFASALVTNRREILDYMGEIQHQQTLRREAEEQLRLLAESSPAAVFTLDERAQVLSANRATRELLGLEAGAALIGRSITQNLPVLAEALKLDTGSETFRTAAQVQAKRWDGEPFLAQAWFSTYRVNGGSLRLAAIAVDSTEETREREEQSQQHMLDSNRIIAGAIAHEVRNVCSAMSVVYANLQDIPGLLDNRDYQALGGLVSGLARLAHLELQGRADVPNSSADLRDVVNQLRILIKPPWEEEDAAIYWPDLAHPLLVAADSFTLLQACLNIANNSLSAISGAADKRLAVSVETTETSARVSFTDSGPGISDPDGLFQPFRSGSGRVGLGLYISRALLRRYSGDVRYEPVPAGARFILEVPLYGVNADAATRNEHNPTLAGR